MPRRKFYSFYVRAAIDRDTMEWTTKFPRSKPCAHLLRYLSLAGFVCGFSVLNPSVDYAGEDEEKLCLRQFWSPYHKGFNRQGLRMRKGGSCKAQILENARGFC